MDIIQFSNILEEIKNKCDTIIRQCILIGKALNKTNNEIVNEIGEKHTKEKKEQILECVQNYLLKQSEDARIFLKDYQTFFSVTQRGFKPKNETSEFLFQLWMGDMYGQTGVEALKQFLLDLNTQFLNIHKKNIVNNYPYGDKK